ncbi:MAG: cation:proton antiporter [Dehalococcoidia bacterium]|nr:cation:proton antiporter [Dehalococcoidia bacterium]MDD5493228.1 cation:proton antiporter [Dehalococcoidia bacterium]
MVDQNPMISIIILLAAALAGGMIAHRLRQPIILGYLIIGIIVGPYSLAWVGDPELVRTAASIGVALLMFTVGLEISFSQLKDIGRIGIWGGIGQIGITLILVTAVGLIAFNWSLQQSVLFGLIISLSSTAVCLKMLMERGELSTVQGRIMVSFLILQDISVVVMMVIMPIMGGTTGNLAQDLGMAALKSILFIGLIIILGRWVLPWLLGNVGGVRSRELFLLTVIVTCLGAAAGTYFLGLSIIFGAFLVGMVLRSTRFVHQALAEITPLRDIFATLFFVSLGMLLDPMYILHNWPLVLLLVAVIIVVKIAVVFGIVRLFGYSNRIAVLTGAGLFQIGEFGFVLAQGGLDQGIISGFFYSLIIASTVVTMLLTPVSFSLVSRMYPRLAPAIPGQSQISQGTCPPPSHNQSDKPGRVIIAGYGRVGRNLASGLQDAGIPYLIVDIDPECIDEAKTCGSPRLYGDATNSHVLAQADLCNASAMAITFPDQMAVESTVKAALNINPELKILARYHTPRQGKALEALGVSELINPEHEAGFKFLKQVLKISGLNRDDRKQVVDLVRNEGYEA